MSLTNEERKEYKRLKGKHRICTIDHWEYNKLRFLTLKKDRVGKDERWR
jgi:hypothetical protein